MAKMKTVLGFFVVLLLAGNAFSQLRPGLRRGLPRPLEASGTAAQEDVQSGIPGVTAPFIPFDEKDKIKYEDAVERAKKNDSEAFYWLAYYFINGEGVEKNREAAGKFLQKAIDARNAKACYLAGLHHEFFHLVDEHNRSVWSWNGLLPKNERLEIESVLQNAGIYDLGSISLLMPKENDSNNFQAHRPVLFRSLRSNGENCCYTNDIATGFVIGLYSSAVKGGLSYATNDIARLKRTIAKCRERIATEEKAHAKGTAALDLLVDASKRKNEERQNEYEQRKREREYWATWPNKIDSSTLNHLIADVERRFNCIFIPNISSAMNTNTWFCTSGKSLVFSIDSDCGDITCTFQKINSEGRIIAWGLSENRTDLEEFKYFEAQKEKYLNLLRGNWAKERGLTLEEATQKYNEWETSKSRMFRRVN